MSYILDALKRSERSRQRHRPLVYRSAAPSAQPIPAALLALLIAVGVAGVVAGIFWWSQSSTPSVPEAPLAEAPAQVSAVASNSQRGNPPAVTGRARVDSAARPLAQTVVTQRRPPPPREAGSGPIALLSTLPAEFQDRLPPMEVNIHVYSPDASQRILYINNRAYRQGDEVTGGAVVEEVVADGVVLYYDGQRFRLPRPR